MSSSFRAVTGPFESFRCGAGRTLTFVCTRNKEDAGPNNNWMAPSEAHAKMSSLFAGCMKGRTLYVVPYCMGPLDSPLARYGIEITDSAYVVLNMHMMTRMGRPALELISRTGKFVKGLHSIGELDPNRRFIMHFPKSCSSRVLAPAMAAMPCLARSAMRCASPATRPGPKAGWPNTCSSSACRTEGRNSLHCCGIPSACGKTNLAMLIPPDSMPGWKVFTVGDDIAWLHPGADGRLWAINPEAGYFGVALAPIRKPIATPTR